MSLFSFFRKNKQEDAAQESAFYSRAEADSQAVRPRKRKAVSRDDADGATNTPVDPVLPEKKRARRRLLGAVALVLAVIIGLPMVLDSEPKPLPDDLTIEIPSKDRAPAATVSKPIGKRSGVAMPVPALAGLDQKEEIVEMPAAIAPPKLSAAGKDAEPTLPVKTKAPPAKPKTEASTASRSLAAVPAAAPAPAGTPSPAPAPAPAKPAASEADTAVKNAKFTLQVAAFASLDKVNELRSKLKEAGIATYTQKVATENGERIRIRIGPLNSKQDAEKLRARLTSMGLTGTLVPSPS